MPETQILGLIADSVVNLETEKTKELCRQALQAGIPAQEIMMKGIAEGLRIVGKKFEAMEYFLTELLMAGEIAKDAFEILKHDFVSKGLKFEPKGKVVIGTVRGDIHDIGKNIAAATLEGSGFEVFDLGVDVPAEKFVEKVKETNSSIVGISCLISTTLPRMGEIVKALEKAGFKDKVRIIIGGPPTTPEYARKIGADACASSAVEGLAICEGWVRQSRDAMPKLK